MPKSFSASVAAHVIKAKMRMNAVFLDSVQDVAEIANEPVAQGGRMRVKSGFLRNSQTAAIGSPPSGPSNAKTDQPGNPSEDVALVIAGATVNDIIFVGWSANYARPREARDGFLEYAAKQWPRIVADNVKRLPK